MLTIAADPRHLGARIGITAVLHTWGSAMTHHPHVHMIVPGGGIAPDGQRWISSRPAFLLPVRVLGALFRRLFLTRLLQFHDAGKLAFFGKLSGLADRRAFLRHLSPVRKKRWVVYAKPPFAGPEAVLAYLSRYTHRVAISNSRLLAFNGASVTFRYKDYRRSGADRQQVMTLAAEEFIRRFLLHVLPKGFHRIRHYGLLAGGTRKAQLERARELLQAAPPPQDSAPEEPPDTRPPCPCCGGRMIVIETFVRLAAAPCAAMRPVAEPGGHAMTRHGSSSSRRAACTLPATTPLTLCTPTGDATAHPSLGAPRHHALTPRPSTITAGTGGRSADHRTPLPGHPKTEKPIAHRGRPAASCLGGYRTPAGARYPSH